MWRRQSGSLKRGLLALALVGVVAASIASTSAPAAGAAVSARGLMTGFIDEQVFSSSDAQTRSQWMLRAKTAGSNLIRITVPWRQVSPTKPLLPTNPGDSSYDMSSIDAQVESAHALGLQVMLTTYLAPDWAEGPNRPAGAPTGTWMPNAKAFGDFGQMLATRYSGFYSPSLAPGAPALPKVRYFEAWNEPNLTVFLAPQWVGNTPYSPRLYRGLLNEFYDGVHLVQPGDVVIGGGTAPFGDNSPDHPFVKGNPRMHPLVFFRKLFCLADDLKPVSCLTKPKLDVLSHHPVNIINAPTKPAPNPEDVEVADFHKLKTLLDAAERAGHITPAGNHPLWATEVWWLSNPPNPLGADLQTHAHWVEQALYMLWKQGASTVVQYEIRDPAYDPNIPARQQVTSGFYMNNGIRKPAYTAWRFPFVTHRETRTNVGVWGKSPATGTLKIQRSRPGGWQTIQTMSIKAGQVFTSSVRVSGPADLRGQITGVSSLPWHQN
jgi:hypothetical protein